MRHGRAPDECTALGRGTEVAVVEYPETMDGEGPWRGGKGGGDHSSFPRMLFALRIIAHQRMVSIVRYTTALSLPNNCFA